MSRKTEMARLKKIALETGGYIAKPCPTCSWWRLEAGDKKGFEQDYCPDIRCRCEKKAKLIE